MARKKLVPPTQQTISRPAPIGGLNVRDALPAMPPEDAVRLVNWIPNPYGMKARKGYREWARGMGGNQVDSIVSWYGPTNPAILPTPEQPSNVPGKMFAVTKAGFYDVTALDVAPPLVQALSGVDYAGRVYGTMFTNIAGSYLAMCSETDGYYHYNGTTFVKPTFGGGAGQVGGCDPALFCFVTSWKRRLWFVERNSTSVWYLPTDSITGLAVEFDVGPFLKNGGTVAYIANWTLDAGTGIDDMLVIVSENGDVLVYKGTDPASASTFSLVGSWPLGEIPRGRRGFTQYGGDLLLLGNTGLYPLSFVTRGGAQILQASDKEYTSKIQELVAGAMSTTFSLYGWDVGLYARDSLLIINAANYGELQNRQFVMNTSNSSWCLFQDVPCTCMNVVAGFLFFGTPDGRVIIAQDGELDNVLIGTSTGSYIVGEVQPAFSYFESIGKNKQFLMVRPTFLSVDQPGVYVTMNTDFTFNVPAGVPTYAPTNASLWGTGLWDSAIWGGQQYTFQNWIAVNGVGYAGSLTLKTNVAGGTLLASIDYMFEVGGSL